MKRTSARFNHILSEKFRNKHIVVELTSKEVLAICDAIEKRKFGKDFDEQSNKKMFDLTQRKLLKFFENSF